jgi:hypothetical protein
MKSITPTLPLPHQEVVEKFPFNTNISPLNFPSPGGRGLRGGGFSLYHSKFSSLLNALIINLHNHPHPGPLPSRERGICFSTPSEGGGNKGSSIWATDPEI